MEKTILVTGGTGGLGRSSVEQLKLGDRDIRLASRADFETPQLLASALEGCDTVLHLATTRKSDLAITRMLLDAARETGVAHLIYISIVGVDRIPFPYYVDKLACERLIEASGVPFTILRATQFHQFVVGFLGFSARLPVTFVLDVLDQPIAVEEVAARLVELADAAPAGRVSDIGGPQQLALRELAGQWQEAHGIRKPIWRLPLAGKTIAAFRRGHHLTALPGYGTQTFAEYAAARARGTNEA